MKSRTKAFCTSLISIGLLAATAAGCGLQDTSTAARPFGSFNLKPGEKREFQTGSTYLSLRVCSDLGNSGPIRVAIADRAPRVLAPGECTVDTGSRIQIENPSGGSAAGIYEPFDNTYGRR